MEGLRRSGGESGRGTKASAFSAASTHGLVARRPLVFLAVALLTLALCGGLTRATALGAGSGTTTVTLISGNGTVGGADSQVTYSLSSASPKTGKAIVVNTYSSWIAIAGTKWVNYAACNVGSSKTVGCPHAGKTATYSISFTVPAGVSSPSLSVDVLADNCLTAISLNGSSFGSEPCDLSNPNNTHDFSKVATFKTTSSFVTGANTLSFAVLDGGTVAGLDFKATLTYSSGATGATASLSTDKTSIAMSGPNDAISDIPLSAFEPTPAGTTPPNVNGLPDQRAAHQRPADQRPPDQRPARSTGSRSTGSRSTGSRSTACPSTGSPSTACRSTGSPSTGCSCPE